MKELSEKEITLIDDLFLSSRISAKVGTLLNEIIQDLNLLWEIVADSQLDNMDFGKRIITEDDIKSEKICVQTFKSKIDSWLIQVHDKHGNKLESRQLTVKDGGEGMLIIENFKGFSESDIVCWVIY